MKNLGAEKVWPESGAPSAELRERLGCGLCTGECPMGAIELMHHREDQLTSEIKAAFA
jgi:heterodisulfide reductase subunit A-like polyferredoxin